MAVLALPSIDVSPVNLDTSDAPDNAVNLPTSDNADAPLSPDIARQRAAKTSQGLGDKLQKSEDELYQEFLAGNETMLRKQAATRLDFDKAMEKQKTIQTMAAQANRPLNPEEVLKIVDPFNPANAPADPDTVIERAYADKTLSTLSTARGFMLDNIVNNAKQELPKTVDDALTEGSELLTKNQYILHRLQNTESLMQDQSNIGYAADFAKNLFQPYVEFKQRGLIGSALSGLGLGSNLDEAHSTLYRMPMSEFKATFDKAMDHLERDNPQLAAQYAHSLLGQSTFDSTLNNMFTVAAVPDYLAIGKLGAKVVKGVRTAGQVRTAVKDMVQAAAKDPDATPATVAEGAGDLKEAAVQRMAAQLDAAAKGGGNPIELAKDTLLSTWYDDAKKFVSNPGTYLGKNS